MAGRIRTIKPELLDDSKAGRLTDGSWRLWVSSWLLADDYGNFRADPSQLAGQVFWGSPRSSENLRESLRELEESGMLIVYTVNDQQYAHITGWGKHQRIDNAGKPRCPKLNEGEKVRGDSPRVSANPGLSRLDHRPPTTEREHRKKTTQPNWEVEQVPQGGRRVVDLGGVAEYALAEGTFAGQPQPEKKPRRKPGLAGASADELGIIERVLERLSDRSGRSYSPKTETHAQRILRLLRLGHSEGDIRMVVWDRANAWSGNEKMQPYLRPCTLFGPEKFPDYLAEAIAADAADKREEQSRTSPAPSELCSDFFDGLDYGT